MDSDAGNSPHATVLAGEALPGPAARRDPGPRALPAAARGRAERGAPVRPEQSGRPPPAVSAAAASPAPTRDAFVLRDNCGATSLVPQQSCNVFVTLQAHPHRRPHRDPAASQRRGRSRRVRVTERDRNRAAAAEGGRHAGGHRLRACQARRRAPRRTWWCATPASSRSRSESLGVTPAAGGFSARQSGCLGAALAPGATCRVTVRFRPLARRCPSRRPSPSARRPAPGSR